MKIFMLLIMLFCHIVDDWYLQGSLTDMKQEKWWKQQCKKKGVLLQQTIYWRDYKVALIEHAFSWTFMVMATPMMLMIFSKDVHLAWFLTLFIINWIIHGIVDDLKANKMVLNLVLDQLIHVVQVVVTWVIMLYGVIPDIYK